MKLRCFIGEDKFVHRILVWLACGILARVKLWNVRALGCGKFLGELTLTRFASVPKMRSLWSPTRMVDLYSDRSGLASYDAETKGIYFGLLLLKQAGLSKTYNTNRLPNPNQWVFKLSFLFYFQLLVVHCKLGHFYQNNIATHYYLIK